MSVTKKIAIKLLFLSENKKIWKNLIVLDTLEIRFLAIFDNSALPLFTKVNNFFLLNILNLDLNSFWFLIPPLKTYITILFCIRTSCKARCFIINGVNAQFVIFDLSYLEERNIAGIWIFIGTYRTVESMGYRLFIE